MRRQRRESFSKVLERKKQEKEKKSKREAPSNLIVVQLLI
jgi:hypothetical protein